MANEDDIQPVMVSDPIGEFLGERQTAYIKTFINPMGDKVLADLAQFCRAGQSTFDPDPRVSALLEGRREVFLRILQHLELPQEKLRKLFAGAERKDLR